MRMLCALLLLCSQALAGDAGLLTIRADFTDYSGTQLRQGGTGVVVGKRANEDTYIALTNAHVVQTGHPNTTYYAGAADKWWPVKSVHLIGSPDDVDAAYIVFSCTAKLRIATLAKEDAPTGTNVQFAGFPGADGRQVRIERQANVRSQGFATTRFRPEQGMSGGGVYNDDGKLVGLIKGYYDDTDIKYVPLGAIQQRAKRNWGYAWGSTEDPPEEVDKKTGWGCPSCPGGFGIGGGIGIGWGNPQPRQPPRQMAPPPPDLNPQLGQPQSDPPPAPTQPSDAPPPMSGTPGPKGEPGPKGDKGDTGDKGDPADPKELESIKVLMAQLITQSNQLKQQLDDLKNLKTPVRVRGADKQVHSEEQVQLLKGEAINLDFEPVTIDQLKALLKESK